MCVVSFDSQGAGGRECRDEFGLVRPIVRYADLSRRIGIVVTHAAVTRAKEQSNATYA